MKMALVYDYVNQNGGGERVLALLLNIFPEADLYTIFYDPKLDDKIPPIRVKGTSWLNHSLVRKNHHYFIPLLPKAAESINLGDRYDVILSVGAGYAKGITYTSGKHIDYCFTPLRYAVEPDHFLKHRFGPTYYKLLKPILSPLIKYLKNWDYEAGRKPEKMLTLSRYIREKIRESYGREAEILYPPVDRDRFYPAPGPEKGSYYLAAGRLLHYKGFELIVEAFNQMQLPLLIVGRGPRLKKLIKLNTSAQTKFVTYYLSDEEMRWVYSNAKAFIFPQVEDFGLVAAEAIACGTPVIAYHRGGARDIVKPGRNGFFISEQTPEAIIEAIDRLGDYNFNPQEVARTAEKFNLKKFREEITEAVRI